MRIGFLPLLDCAPLAVAQEKSIFARHGLEVELCKAQTWGQVRDRLLLADLDAAQLLITMPVQCALESGGYGEPLCYAYTLSRGGNGIILGNALWNAGARDARGLADWLAKNPGRTARLGVVFPRGTQEYFLRSWLAEAGLHLGDRIELKIHPPQEMVGKLRKGELDGFCVGQPWSQRAAASKLGRLVADSGRALPGVGEKVLGVRTAWHHEHRGEHARLVLALGEAAAWLEQPENRAEAVEMLASKRYVNTPKSAVESALGARVPAGAAAGDPHAPAAAHARWYLEQMRRWGHVDARAAGAIDLTQICLEEFYRASQLHPQLRNS